MADRAAIVKKIIEEGQSSKNDTLVAHLAEDAVVNIPMRGEIKGKSAILATMSSPQRTPTPSGASIGEPEIDGENVKVTATLPPGQMLSRLVFSFQFEGEMIKRMDISL